MFRQTFHNKNISRKLVLAIAFSIFLTIATVGGAYILIDRQITVFFLKTFETKSLAQLETYHTGRMTDIKDLFEHIFDITKRLSQDKGILNGLKSGDMSKVKELLEEQRNINHHLESWYVFDQTGKIIVISSGRPELESAVGRNFSNRDYFQIVMKTRKPYMSQQLSGVITGNPFIAFSVPIMNEKKKVVYVLTGSTTIKILQEQLKLKTHFSHNYNILVDWDYDVLYENGQVLSRQINVKDRDRIISRLSQSTQRLIEEEINYKGEQVIAMGDKIQFAQNKESTYYLVSYFIKSEFDRQVKDLKQEIKRISTGVFILIIFMIIAEWSLNIWLIHLFITNKRTFVEWKNLAKKLLP